MGEGKKKNTDIQIYENDRMDGDLAVITGKERACEKKKASVMQMNENEKFN